MIWETLGDSINRQREKESLCSELLIEQLAFNWKYISNKSPNKTRQMSMRKGKHLFSERTNYRELQKTKIIFLTTNSRQFSFLFSFLLPFKKSNFSQNSIILNEKSQYFCWKLIEIVIPKLTLTFSMYQTYRGNTVCMFDIFEIIIKKLKQKMWGHWTVSISNHFFNSLKIDSCY